MRLLRVAVASVNTTVGAVRSNVDRAVLVARAAASDGATIVALPEQTVGGYPQEDLVQWRRFVEAQRAELERFARETADIDAALVDRRDRRARPAPLQLRGARPRAGACSGSSRRRSCRSTTCSTNRARSPRGVAGLRDDVTRRGHGPVRRPRLRPRLRRRGRRGVRGHLVARRPDAPALLRGGRARREPLGLAVPPRRRRDAARDDRDARGRQPVHASPTRTSSAPTTGSSSTAGASSRRTAACVLEAAALPRGVRRGDASTSIARGACASRTRRGATDQEAFAATRRRRHVRPRSRSPSPPRGASASRYPAPPHGSFFLPTPDVRRARPARAFCEDLLDALALGIGDYFEKTGVVQDDRRRALRAGATACSASSSRAATSSGASRDLDRGRAPREGRARCSARVLHAHALLVARDPRRRRARRRATRGAVHGRAPSTTPSSASSAEVDEDAPARRGAHAAGAPERAGAHPRRAHVDAGPTAPQGSSCRRAT